LFQFIKKDKIEALKYENQLKQWDELIRTGYALKVRALCRQLNHKKIPRALLVEYAQIARRVGAPDLIILWLRPIVRSDKTLQKAATAEEKAIYGLGLLRLGAFHEAQSILSEIDPEKDPQVYFYQASLFMNQWNYQKAIPKLRKYVHHPAVNDYSKLVGRLNLCAALLGSAKTDVIANEISSLMKILERKNIVLLKGNLLEIRSQWLIEQGQYKQALEDLEQAAQILNKADERSLIYVNKWRLIVKLKSSPHPKELLSEIVALKKQAVAAKDWETVRDCDLHLALTLKDKDLILKVFWGSKFLAYKQRVKKNYGDFDSGENYVWSEGQTTKNNPPIDLVNEAPTPILRRLFYVLTQELYQPIRLTELIDSLYPNEYYHPISSPARLHRLIARARIWLKEKNYPIELQAYRNAYKLHLIDHAQILLTQKAVFKKSPTPPEHLAEFFTTKEWAFQKNVSERTARREILKLIRAKRIESFIRGPHTKYRLI